MVVIITLNYNQNEYTLKCVESILKITNISFHLLLIDNGSSKDNVTHLKTKLPISKNLTLKLIEKNCGYVGGINFGLKEGAKLAPSHFLIMNNDTIIHNNALRELVKTCELFNNKAIVTGKVYHYDEPNKIQDIGYSYLNKRTLIFKRLGLNELDKGQYDCTSERDMLDDIFWLIPFQLYKKIGGYSHYYWFNAEQVDFVLKAKREDYKLIYTPKAKLWHKGSVSIGGRSKNPKLAYWHVQSSLILRYIHLNKLNFFVYFINTLKSVIFTTFKSYYLYLTGDNSLLMYAYAKRKAVIYFLKWTIFKNKNTGNIPF